MDLSASKGKLSEMKYWGTLLLADDEAGELRPSNEVSGKCFDDEVVDEAGEFACLVVNLWGLWDFDPCRLVAIINFRNHNPGYIYLMRNQSKKKILHGK